MNCCQFLNGEDIDVGEQGFERNRRDYDLLMAITLRWIVLLDDKTRADLVGHQIVRPRDRAALTRSRGEVTTESAMTTMNLIQDTTPTDSSGRSLPE